jgi:hypothetical protein
MKKAAAEVRQEGANKIKTKINDIERERERGDV